MKTLSFAIAAALTALTASPCFAESRGAAQRYAGQNAPQLINPDPLTQMIMRKLSERNGGVRSFAATANDKAIELTSGPDPLQSLKPLDGLAKPAQALRLKPKTTSKALPQLKAAADQGRLQ